VGAVALIIIMPIVRLDASKPCVEAKSMKTMVTKDTFMMAMEKVIEFKGFLVENLWLSGFMNGLRREIGWSVE